MECFKCDFCSINFEEFFKMRESATETLKTMNMEIDDSIALSNIMAKCFRFPKLLKLDGNRMMLGCGEFKKKIIHINKEGTKRA